MRTYLREMGTVRCCTREGETEIARRIERGQNTVMKGAVALAAGDPGDPGPGRRSAARNIAARDVVLVADPLMIERPTEESGQELIAMAEDAARHFRKFQQLRQKLTPFRAA